MSQETNTNAVIKCLNDHRTVRKFTDRKIEPEMLETILHAGTRAANGGNLQLYTFLVLDDQETLADLDKALEVPFIERSNCATVVMALADHHRVRRWLQMHSDSEVVNNRPYGFFMAMWDALIALQNAVVAAESLGLGTCYLGSGPELDIKKLYGAPEYVFPAGMVCLGYPVARPKLSMRLPLEATVHHNRYRMPTDDDINRWYAERDRVWDKVPKSRKAELAGQKIAGIAQALAVQKFSPEIVELRSKGMLVNLRKSGFDLVTGLEGE